MFDNTAAPEDLHRLDPTDYYLMRAAMALIRDGVIPDSLLLSSDERSRLPMQVYSLRDADEYGYRGAY